MANIFEGKNLISLTELAIYDGEIKSKIASDIGTEGAKSLKTVSLSGNTLNFYRSETPAQGEQPAYSITLPETDLTEILSDIAAIEDSIGTVPQGDTVVGMISDVSDEVSALDSSLASVAKSGDAADVAYDNTTSNLTATDVQDAIDEIAAASAGGVGSKTVYVTETAGTSADAFSKRYGIYQGATGSSASPAVGEKLVDIDIPKDMVVESGSVVTITFNSSDNKLYDGVTDVTELIKGIGGTATSADAGKYIKLTIANATSDTIYISVKDLVDIYTAEANATQVQLVIDANNEISATIVAGSITATELASNAVTTAKIADGNVTLGKLATAVQTSLGLADTAIQQADMTADNVEYDTNVSVADALDAINSTLDDLDTSYDAYGSATTAENNAKSYADGLASNYDAAGAAATAESNANDYTDAEFAKVTFATESQIRALFQSNNNNNNDGE